MVKHPLGQLLALGRGDELAELGEGAPADLSRLVRVDTEHALQLLI